MNFCEQVKSVLSKYETDDFIVKTAELYGFVVSRAFIELLGRGNINLRFECDYAFVAAKVYSLLKRIFSAPPVVAKMQSNSFGKKTCYIVTFEDARFAKELLHYYGIMDGEGRIVMPTAVDESFLQDDESAAGFLRGVFLACGYIADPSKSIQMEFVFKNSLIAESFMGYLNKFGIISKQRMKKDDTIIYIRKAEYISDFLAVTGDHRDTLILEDKLAMRQMKNTMQRKVNCETANLNKTSEAAFVQMQAIEKIIKLKGLNTLSEPLIKAAQLRLDNPYASLSELANAAVPPLSRSTLDKRLRKIVEIAQLL